MCGSVSLFRTTLLVLLVLRCECLASMKMRAHKQRGSIDRTGDALVAGLSPSDVPVLSSGYGSSYVNWSFCNATYQSNLGGLGPDSGEKAIRYSNIATAGGGLSVDLVVTAVGNYKAKNVSVNGLVGKSSCFGVINLKSAQDSSNSVLLNFDLVLHGTNTSVAFDRAYFTLFDLDGSNDVQEAVTFYDGVDEYYLRNNSDWLQSGDAASGLTFTSTTAGSGGDNPTDPEALTEVQKKRSVTVGYVGRNQWRMTFTVNGGKRGRNFVFAGHSGLVETTPSAPVSQVSVSVTLAGVDYGALVADEAIRTLVEDAIRAAIISESHAGIGSGDVVIVLSPGSVVAVVTIVVPQNVSASVVVEALEAAENGTSFPSSLAADVQQIAGIDQVSSGPVSIMLSSPVLTTLPPTPTPTPPPPTPAPTACTSAVGTCTIHDDPHITVFDGKQIWLLSHAAKSQVGTHTYFEAKEPLGTGDMWLVQSSSISIQARYAPSADLPEASMFVHAVAVGGPFLLGNTLVVEPLDGKVTWNGMEILAFQNSNFSVPDLVHARRGLSSRLVQNPNQANPGIDLALPGCVDLTVNRQQTYVNVLVQMPKSDEQAGLCGNFNGRSDDDNLELLNAFGRSPRVAPGESLFDLEFERRRVYAAVRGPYVGF